jgi:hypothetical protein
MVEAHPQGLRPGGGGATRYGNTSTFAVVKSRLEKAKVRGSAKSPDLKSRSRRKGGALRVFNSRLPGA